MYPKVASGKLAPGIGFTDPSGPYLPLRAPRMIAPVSAAQPPVEWTRSILRNQKNPSKPDAAAPDPTCLDRVDDGAQENHEYQERPDFNTLRQSAGDNGRRRSDEDHLEEPIRTD